MTPKVKTIQKRGPKGTKIARVLYFANGVRALDMRLNGMPWGEIAETLQLPDANTALKCARAAKEKLDQESAEELRAIHHDRYEFMFKSLMPKISQGRERAIEVAAKVLESDAKLMGINADAEKEQGNFQPILIQIRANPNDAAAVKRVAAKEIIDNPARILPSPDSSV